MPKIPKFEPVEIGGKWMVSVPPSMTADGVRVRKTFRTEPKARAYAASVRAAHNSGIRGAMISASLAIQAIEADRILAGSGISLTDAARAAVAQVANDAKRETFRSRYDRAMASQEMLWSDRYSMDMARLPSWVSESFMGLPCGIIDRQCMEAALTEFRNLKRSTIDNRVRYLSAILNYRERHRKEAGISILSPAQVGRCLRVCETVEERRVVAILFFAGVRPDSEFGEISRLDWSAFSASKIYIDGAISKTSTDRHIPISGRLRRLIRGHPESGPVMPSGWKKRWQRIRRDSGISDLIDVARHTYASNMLAASSMEACQSALGHVPMSQTTRRHYARAVLRDDAVRYFR